MLKFTTSVKEKAIAIPINKNVPLIIKGALLLSIALFWALTSSAQVLITELADPNNSTGARYVELYNAGSSPVDLGSGWALRRWTNGNTAPQSSDVALTGCIPAGGFYLVAANGGTFMATYGTAADQSIGTGGPADSNGDDQIALVDPSSSIVDIFGVPGQDGTGTCHEFEDGRAERASSVTSGNGTWNEAEWNVWADSQVNGCTNHTQAAQDAPGIFDPGAWIGNTPSACGIAVCIESVACNSYTAGPGDTYDLSIPYNGVQAGVSVVNNSGSGSISGDDPATVSNGTIVISGIDEANAYNVTFTSDCNTITVSGAAPICEAALSIDILINEVDYDNAGTDDREFIELVNVSGGPYDLTGCKVELVNGNGDAVYNTINLDPVILAAGEYYVLCGNGGFVSNCDQVIPSFTNIIQNGAPDGLRFIDANDNTLDQLSYEGDMSTTETTGVSSGDINASGLSIQRTPDGTDTDNNDADFGLYCITPGMANMTTSPSALSVDFGSVTAECDAVNPGPGDTYTLTIPYSNMDPAAVVTVNTASGTMSLFSDDPALDPDGFLMIEGISESENYDVTIIVDCSPISITGPAPECDPPTPPAILVINEVDYDQSGTDAAEFIEIYNADIVPVDLGNYVLELVNGSNNSIYNSIILNSVVIAPGEYYVVCGDAANVPNCDQDVSPSTNLIQNGAPDAIGLRNAGGVLLDVVSYEGSVPGYTETSGVSPGDNSDDMVSISRAPNGSDTGDNDADFIRACSTPGEANAANALFCVCEPPVASISTSCIDEFTFNVLVDLTAMGSALSVDITNNLTASSALGVTVGIHTLGPFNNNDVINVLVAHDAESECDLALNGITDHCPPANDACYEAAAIVCGGTAFGDTEAAIFDDMGTCGGVTNTAPGVWFSVSGTGDIFVASTDNPGTDYDTQVSVYATIDGLNCLAVVACVDGNDDIVPGINLASQVAWTSVIGQDYLILVHGSGSAVGHSELTLECVEPLTLESTTGCQTSFVGYEPAEAPNYIQACADGGTQPYTFDWVQVSPPPAPSTILFSQSADGICTDAAVQPTASGCTMYSVVVTDANGIQMAEFIEVCQVDIDCANNPNSTKVEICHNGITICVSENAVQNHIDHGDSYGPCDLPCGESLPPIVQGSAGPIATNGSASTIEEARIEVYPNPTSGITNVQFTVPEAGNVDLTLYSMDGKKVDQIFNGIVEAGALNVADFNAASLPSGVYLYHLISNDTVLSGRIQITR